MTAAEADCDVAAPAVMARANPSKVFRCSTFSPPKRVHRLASTTGFELGNCRLRRRRTHALVRNDTDIPDESKANPCVGTEFRNPGMSIHSRGRPLGSG